MAAAKFTYPNKVVKRRLDKDLARITNGQFEGRDLSSHEQIIVDRIINRIVWSGDLTSHLLLGNYYLLIELSDVRWRYDQSNDTVALVDSSEIAYNINGPHHKLDKFKRHIYHDIFLCARDDQNSKRITAKCKVMCYTILAMRLINETDPENIISRLYLTNTHIHPSRDEMDLCLHCCNIGYKCVYCSKPGSRDVNLKKCASCGTRYCNVDCQRKDWPAHRRDCQQMKKKQ